MAISVDDPELPARIRAGDADAIQVVVQTYLEQILRTALGAGLPRQAAEDVTQATFVTFIERQADFEGRSHVRTWIFGILYRKIAEARRKQQRDHQLDDIDEVVEQRFKTDGSWLRPPRSVETEVYESEIRGHLADCMETLPDRQRLAFVLRECLEARGVDRAG